MYSFRGVEEVGHQKEYPLYSCENVEPQLRNKYMQTLLTGYNVNQLSYY